MSTLRVRHLRLRSSAGVRTALSEKALLCEEEYPHERTEIRLAHALVSRRRSSGPAFIDQMHRTLNRIHPHFDSVWVDDHLLPWAEWQSNDTPYLECLTTIAYFAAAYPTLNLEPVSSASLTATPACWQDGS